MFSLSLCGKFGKALSSGGRSRHLDGKDTPEWTSGVVVRDLDEAETGISVDRAGA